MIGFAEELGGLGIAGGRVALVMRNTVDICIVLFAIHMARAQAAPGMVLDGKIEVQPFVCRIQLAEINEAFAAAHAHDIGERTVMVP